MAYRNPAQVKDELKAHPRRVLVITTVVHESNSVKSFLTDPEILVGEKGDVYEYGRFSDPAGDWLVVHALTPQGNSDAGLVVRGAHQEFGKFHAQMFVGIAGSLKADIPIGSVVIGDYVYNGHSAKVEDKVTLGKPQGLVPARELLTAAKFLIYSKEWISMIRPPHGMDLPSGDNYPCPFPPLAEIKGIVSGEEIVAGGKSKRFTWLRTHFNNCGAVEMEGWGAMNGAHYENTPAIVVRGISDMCAGKDPVTDKLNQPIAAAHAAAFAFSILSFRSKVPPAEGPVVCGDIENSVALDPVDAAPKEQRRVEFVFNFEGSTIEWPDEKVNIVVEQLKRAIGDEELQLIRVDIGSVRLVMGVRESDIAAMDMPKLRQATLESGVTLLGAVRSDLIGKAEVAMSALAAASRDLLVWDRTLPNGRWMERPERQSIEMRFKLYDSATILLGEPGSGKSALLSKIAADLLARGGQVFAIKADFLPSDVRNEADLQRELQLPALPSELILRLSALQPVYVLVDQLDALASQLDLQSGRLNVLLNLVRRVAGEHNVHVLLSARTFEFNHDARLRTIDAEAVTLALPPWHEVMERLVEVGIDADAWPENARGVVRIPQALKTFIALVGSGRTEPFSTYQAMLQELWDNRVASASDSVGLIALASSLAEQMANEEVLWLAASRFDDRLTYLHRLEALGFIVRSEHNLSVAFSHQTLFDYVLARTFVRQTGLLSTYVLARQDSLFVRAKVWSALNYLREAEATSYQREFVEIWNTKELRRHLRVLLIEFLGQVVTPLEFEKTCFAEALKSSDLSIFALKAIDNNSAWFSHFAMTAIKAAMFGSEVEAWQASRLLGQAWKENSGRVVKLIEECWLPYPDKDTYSWMSVKEAPLWTKEVEAIAATVLQRTPIAIWHVTHVAMTLATEQADVALRLVRAKLDFLLVEAKSVPEKPPFPEAGTEDEQLAWHILHDKSKALRDLLDLSVGDDIPTLAEAAPETFLQNCWPWYVTVFSDILVSKCREDDAYIYPGRYFAEIELVPSEHRSTSREKPLMTAIQIAVEAVAESSPTKFLEWAEANSNVEFMAAQQLIARGYEIAAEHLASSALEWLLADPRRFQLGTVHGHRRTTIDLVHAGAAHWSQDDIGRVEKAALNYDPDVPLHLDSPEQRRRFADMVRATRKDVLQAVGIERLAPENRDLVATEERALGDRFGWSIRSAGGGVVGSPMDAAAMGKAKDLDILRIFQEIPDKTNWDHPKHSMRGGNVQLSREFAELARVDPERGLRLIKLFEPLHQERAAGYALEAMAEEARNSHCIVDALLDLHARKFRSQEFRDSAARAIEKIAGGQENVNDKLISVLVEWLEESLVTNDDEGNDTSLESASKSKDDAFGNNSLIWGHAGLSFLPGGNFTVLSALASVLMRRKEDGRDRYFAILEDHLLRERDPNIWKALLYRLNNAGGSTPHVASTFFRKLFQRFPQILSSQEAVSFLAHAQRWDDRLVFELIADWPKSDDAFSHRAYGELVGLAVIGNSRGGWVPARDEIIASGSDEMKFGLAYAAVNLFADETTGQTAGQTLVALLKGASKELVAVAMDVFRVVDEFVPNPTTVQLLAALADPETDMSSAPSSFVVERLQAILPHEAVLVAKIAEKLVAAWRGQLADMRTATALVAPQLTDLALTLHRLGGTSRQSGVDLFEAMIEIDAYGARDTLAEIDGRFGPQQPALRQRLARRRKPSASVR